MFFEGDSESRNSSVVNSVDSAIPHSGISVRFDQISAHRQIWSDVIKSGVHVQHLDQYLIHCNLLRNLRVSPFELRDQLLSMTDFGYSHISVWTPRSFQNDVSARMNRISAQDGVQMAWTSPKISLAKALRNTDWLPSFPSSFNCILNTFCLRHCPHHWSLFPLSW